MNIIQPTSFAAVALQKGQRLRVVDLEGSQVADVVAFNAHDTSEWLSNGRFFDYGGTLYFTTGATLYSNKMRITSPSISALTRISAHLQDSTTPL